jgi:hypothetical protein
MHRSIGFRWGVWSALGLTAGVSVGILLLGPVELLVGMVLVTPIAFAVSGAILGTSQWFAVRYLARARVWIPLTAVGLGLGLTGGTIAVELVGRWVFGAPIRFSTASSPVLAIALFGFGGLAGLCLGAAQWFCLRRWFSGGGRWILLNGVALGAGVLAGFAAAELVAGGVRSGPGAIVLLFVAAATTGLLTGRQLEALTTQVARSFGPA